jgi:hypothetical protein
VGQALEHVLHEMQVTVTSPVCETVDQPWVSMEPEDDLFVFGEERIVVALAEPVRVLTRGLQFHQIHHIDRPDREPLRQRVFARYFLPLLAPAT